MINRVDCCPILHVTTTNNNIVRLYITKHTTWNKKVYISNIINIPSTITTHKHAYYYILYVIYIKIKKLKKTYYLNLNQQHLVVERKKNVENHQDQKNAFGFCLYLLPCFIKTNKTEWIILFIRELKSKKKKYKNVTYTYRSKKGWWQ
jgi:hypothetical protein